jgi:hypothetical protein
MPNSRTAHEVAGDLELSDDARKLLTPKLGAEAFFDGLVKSALYPDAIRFISRLLTKPQAVWWGCLCVWHTAKPAAGPGEAAVKAAVAWLREPTDPHRRAAGDAGLEAGPASPAGLLGYAVFLSEGSMSPAGQAEVKPGPHVASTCVANAVLAASRTGPPAGTAHRQKTFLGLAVDVYRGTNSWKGNGTAG